MERKEVIILKKCKGSETGLTTIVFSPSDEPQLISAELAEIFVGAKLAKYPTAKATPAQPIKKVEVKKEEPIKTGFGKKDEYKNKN